VSGNPWTPGPWVVNGEIPNAADARLLAAAPEMAEALERALVWLGPEPHWLADDIRTLLSRIRGDAP